MPDDLQPDQGQGDAGGSPYDSYLQSVPEQAREAAESWFRDTSKGLDAKLQEASEIQKTWGPFQPVQEALAPFRDNPEQLSELVGWWQQVTGDDSAYRTWLTNAARDAGLTVAEAEAELEADIAEGATTPEQLEQLVNQMAEQRLGPIEERFNTLEAEKAIDYESDVIGREIDRLQAEAGVQLSNDQKAMIFDLGMPSAVDAKGNDLPMGDVTWVKAGWDRFQQMAAEANKAFVAEKAKAPASALTGGGGSERQKAPMTFEEAGAQARERWRQSQQ